MHFMNAIVRLSGSSARRLLSTKSRQIKVRFVTNDGIHEALGKEGDSLLDVVINADVPLDGYGACEGTLACCTCHVILEQRHFDRITPAVEEEHDLLDLAPELSETSRLGCQVFLSEADAPEISVRVPSIIDDVRSH
ncbi:unnamed protein product [Dracunculus medinensis]|uniref:2Fe-2S ferredoxin-type domain-containing protein n=1 Tax=Dracunculus medinensis TaxID=318479 RepID=A0A0N4UFT9_DRAME|nr:unnamed protein product [Dracunculus medinensis]